MSNNWIFTVTNLTLGQQSWSAAEIFQNRTDVKLWGISESNPSFRQLCKGDKVVFYVTSGTSRLIAGKAILNSEPHTITSEDKKKLIPFDPSYTHVVELNEIQLFEQSVPIDRYIPDLSFVENKEKWGVYLQGGITKIPDIDYELLTSANARAYTLVESMSFKALQLKASYDSIEDDIINNFYIPVLSKSISYRRLAGFFSSSALAVAARGISDFIANGGKMKLVAGAKLRKSDVEAIAKGLDPKTAISGFVIDDLNSIESEFVKDHVSALAWMVANKKLDIKVAVPVDEHGAVVDEQTVQERGIFHQKVGIFEDEDGNIISFSGSVNETAMGWLYNVEEFKVFRSWIDGEVEHLKSDFQKFERYWYSFSKNVVVLDVPTAIKDKLIEMAPDNFDVLRPKLESWKQRKEIKLRDYQERCVHNWIEHGGTGLVEMATGTGKTYAALASLKELQKKEDHLAVVIAVPFTHLVKQWIKNLHEWNYSGIEAFGSSNSWTDTLMNEVFDINGGISRLLIVVTTHSTFASKKFIEIMSQVKIPMLLIGDEVHGLGAEKTRNGLLNTYIYRIGLSATPRRWLDDEGTEILVNYFGDTVFEFSLKDAIPKYLVPYEYYPHFVELTPTELEEYREYTRKIAKQYFATKDKELERTGLDLLMIQRQRIVVDAENKMTEFEQILDSIGESIHHCLVYCSPAQIDTVQDILNERGILQHKFTAKEDAVEREDILDRFSKGMELRALVAMRCLDEGVDVPSTQMAIFLASSGNPKQFIQRRGRILRKFPYKQKAIIHDIIVVPSMSASIEPEMYEIERKILQRELRRFDEFAKASMNPDYTLNKVYPIQQRYKITLEVSR